MKAIILAAGRGSRMGPLTDKKPKCLVEVGGKPLLTWQIEALYGAGIKQISIVRGYKAEEINVDGVHYLHNQDWQKTNMVISMMKAVEWLEQHICVLSYSDIIYSSGTIRKLVNTVGDIVITYDPNWLQLWKKRFGDPLSDAESFRINETGRLLEIGNRATHVDEIQGQYMGLLKVSPLGFEQIRDFFVTLDEQARNEMDITSLLRALLLRKAVVHTVPIEDKWYEIDRFEDLEISRNDIAKGISDIN